MLLDVSLVTRTLISLVDKHIAASPEAAKVNPLTVSAEPFDKLTGNHTVGLYLYHVIEDPHFKNLPAITSDVPPIRYTPMGLNLHYQLNAHSDIQGAPGIEKEQLLMGLAMKALRDYPIIDDSTRIGGAQVFPAELQGTDNRFRISLLPVLPNEAMNYWNAGNQPLRLAAYYEVSVVLLEPDEARMRAGRVLLYGVYTFVRGAPRLDSSLSFTTFTIPGAASARTVEVRPAEVAIGEKLQLIGSELAGDETTLLIKSPRFANPIEVGTDWGVMATANTIFAVIQPKADGNIILPGIYSAIAKVTTRRLMPDKKMRDFNKTSNETPFIITPRVDSLSAPTGAGVVTVSGTVFKDPDLSPDAIRVFLGPNSLVPGNVASLNPGEFGVKDESTLKFRFPVTGLTPGEQIPFRLIISGAENAPVWVNVP